MHSVKLHEEVAIELLFKIKWFPNSGSLTFSINCLFVIALKMSYLSQYTPCTFALLHIVSLALVVTCTHYTDSCHLSYRPRPHNDRDRGRSLQDSRRRRSNPLQSSRRRRRVELSCLKERQCPRKRNLQREACGT